MKKYFFSLSLAIGLSGAALAGTYTEPYSKNPTLPPLTDGPCFSGGELVIKPFYDITLIDRAPDGHYRDETLQGGGLAIDYFFTETLGLGIDGYWIDDSSVKHSYNLNLTARTTLGSECLAIYAIGGGGVFTNGSTVGSAHIGAGIEYRFTDSVGVFADGRYKWLDGDDITLTSIRAGLSFVF